MPSPDRTRNAGAGPLDAVDAIRRAQGGDASIAPEQLGWAVDAIVEATRDGYEREGDTYAQRRGHGTSEADEYMNGLLLGSVRERIADGRIAANRDGRWRLLDIGAGPGRDLVRFSAEPDVEPVALENSPLFLDLLARVAAELGLPSGAVVSADMRDLSGLADASFHCVRSHATLHHLPVVPHGLGADAAVAETRRVLVPGGIFHVLVKAGDGVEMIDTAEGMGLRFYQLFSRPLLEGLLERNGFTVVHMEDRVSRRAAGDVQWLLCHAAAT